MYLEFYLWHYIDAQTIYSYAHTWFDLWIKALISFDYFTLLLQNFSLLIKRSVLLNKNFTLVNPIQLNRQYPLQCKGRVKVGNPHFATSKV